MHKGFKIEGLIISVFSFKVWIKKKCSGKKQLHQCTVQEILDEEKSKHDGLAQQKWYESRVHDGEAGNTGAAKLNINGEAGNTGAAKLNINCWFASWFDCSRWVAISSLPTFAVSGFNFMSEVGQKSK